MGNIDRFADRPETNSDSYFFWKILTQIFKLFLYKLYSPQLVYIELEFSRTLVLNSNHSLGMKELVFVGIVRSFQETHCYPPKCWGKSFHWRRYLERIRKDFFIYPSSGESGDDWTYTELSIFDHWNNPN